ncbi:MULTISPECIES: ABC transporter permease [Glutamicibacter]|uniref:Glycine/betaine ABC transporter permease n=2 Tax=Glutamicibacter arilaitensis TaxID=256701 RepID=A0A2N7S4L5_9MICC|nr:MULTISPECIES: ABC transporter permease subunit [Glutamicibacter]PMQ21064.1 glycine/betaine ABC transporter permease [Glutamicibacter arilaitensis]CBT75741.1 osmoprotectant (glycine betaine/carnitine/choline/L-proline) ABC transporter, inner membrane subunit [Glutamicibacter arilaitensis Re117]HCH48332.1 glycine/betaine ABC transporter permease [Glutamicibacter sp.]HCJ54263.1 glycine/betaine ABC transporter permease [Glutamicibacter sp.]HCM93991.1 glycine/betaine ABC transporter permease [Gl
MDNFRIPIGDVSEDAIDWIIANLDGFFSVLRTIFIEMYDGLYLVLSTPSFAVVTILIGLIALLARGWQFMLGAVLGLLVIVGVDQWENAMSTLALVIVAAFWALLIALPLGIWAAKSDGFSQVVRPVLDFLQTMPAFVYLIPALMLFRVGVAPGIVATIIFALAPGVRFTELGIRSVDSEVVEAGQAFGSSPGRILRQIQLPLALPTIMAGVNQVIMLSLSMVVIAGMVGAGGLGGDVISSLSRLDTALGVEAGLAVVILAMILDRLTNAFGRQSGLFALFAKKRKAARTAREQQLAA